MEPPRSRGLLCLDALSLKEVDDIRRMAREKARFHRPFNLFVSNTERTLLFSWEKEWKEEEVGTGIHVMSSGELNDPSNPRIRRAREILPDREELRAAGIDKLRETLKDHQFKEDPLNNICVHTPGFSTVSSTILALSKRGIKRIRLFHAEGRPCESLFQDLGRLLKE